VLLAKFRQTWIFANPSADKLYSALSSILIGNLPHAADAAATREEWHLAAMNAMIKKYKHILVGIHFCPNHSQVKPVS
jgi:hypothetical protein